MTQFVNFIEVENILTNIDKTTVDGNYIVGNLALPSLQQYQGRIIRVVNGSVSLVVKGEIAFNKKNGAFYVCEKIGDDNTWVRQPQNSGGGTTNQKPTEVIGQPGEIQTSGSGSFQVIVGLDTNIKNLINQNANQIVHLDNEVQNLATDVTKNETDIKTITTNVSNQASKLQTLESNQNQTQTQLTNTVTQVNKNTSDITTNTSDITNLKTRVGVAETKIVKNTTDITDIYNIISSLSANPTATTKTATALVDYDGNRPGLSAFTDATYAVYGSFVSNQFDGRDAPEEFDIIHISKRQHTKLPGIFVFLNGAWIVENQDDYDTHLASIDAVMNGNDLKIDVVMETEAGASYTVDTTVDLSQFANQQASAVDGAQLTLNSNNLQLVIENSDQSTVTATIDMSVYDTFGKIVDGANATLDANQENISLNLTKSNGTPIAVKLPLPPKQTLNYVSSITSLDGSIDPKITATTGGGSVFDLKLSDLLQDTITQNTADIAQNTADIAQNTADIEQNALDISGLMQTIQDITAKGNVISAIAVYEYIDQNGYAKDYNSAFTTSSRNTYASLVVSQFNRTTPQDGDVVTINSPSKTTTGKLILIRNNGAWTIYEEPLYISSATASGTKFDANTNILSLQITGNNLVSGARTNIDLSSLKAPPTQVGELTEADILQKVFSGISYGELYKDTAELTQAINDNKDLSVYILVTSLETKEQGYVVGFGNTFLVDCNSFYDRKSHQFVNFNYNSDAWEFSNINNQATKGNVVIKDFVADIDDVKIQENMGEWLYYAIVDSENIIATPPNFERNPTGTQPNTYLLINQNLCQYNRELYIYSDLAGGWVRFESYINYTVSQTNNIAKTTKYLTEQEFIDYDYQNQTEKFASFPHPRANNIRNVYKTPTGIVRIQDVADCWEFVYQGFLFKWDAHLGIWIYEKDYDLILDSGKAHDISALPPDYTVMPAGRIVKLANPNPSLPGEILVYDCNGHQTSTKHTLNKYIVKVNLDQIPYTNGDTQTPFYVFKETQNDYVLVDEMAGALDEVQNLINNGQLMCLGFLDVTDISYFNTLRLDDFKGKIYIPPYTGTMTTKPTVAFAIRNLPIVVVVDYQTDKKKYYYASNVNVFTQTIAGVARSCFFDNFQFSIRAGVDTSFSLYWQTVLAEQTRISRVYESGHYLFSNLGTTYNRTLEVTDTLMSSDFMNGLNNNTYRYDILSITNLN